MEELLIGVLFAGLILQHVSSPGVGIYTKLNGYFNRKRYERFALKARASGFEREYEKLYKIYSNGMPFQYQIGVESRNAYFNTKRNLKRNNGF